MTILFKNAKVINKNSITIQDVLFKDGEFLFSTSADNYDTVFSNCLITPGFTDVHVHFREPGFSYKETIKTGSLAAAHGGYTSVCTMPNLNPVPDSIETINEQLDIIKRDACIQVLPYGSITKGEHGQELADMQGMSNLAIAFSDDGRGVQSEDMMLNAMKKAKEIGKIIVAHCEDNSLLHGGYIHDGKYAKENSHLGICSESEYGPIKRDIELSKLTGCKYHVCHISTKESVEYIRQAKKDGVDITCETGPHYLTLSDKDLLDEGRFKMNPPLRDETDRLALIEGIKDGTIDMIATDHAPHSADEKSRGLRGSLMGVVGLECAFPILYTKLVKTGIIDLEKLASLLIFNPNERFNIQAPNSFTVFDLEKEYTINPEEFQSMGRATPFAGESVFGECLLTTFNNKIVYISNRI